VVRIRAGEPDVLLRKLSARCTAVCSRSCRHMREFMCIRGVSDNGESLNLGSFER
jgi:hypothetical protein